MKYIAVLDSEDEFTEKVINALKDTAFLGDNPCYAFVIDDIQEYKEEKWVPVVNIDNDPFDNIIYEDLRNIALRVKHKTGSIDTLIDRLDNLLRGNSDGSN